MSASTASESIHKLAEQGLVDHEVRRGDFDRFGATSRAGNDAPAPATGGIPGQRRLPLGRGGARSRILMARIDAKLGFPQRDPGDPIERRRAKCPRHRLVSCGRAATTTGRWPYLKCRPADAAMLCQHRDQPGLAAAGAGSAVAGMISVAIDSADGATSTAQAIWVRADGFGPRGVTWLRFSARIFRSPIPLAAPSRPLAMWLPGPHAAGVDDGIASQLLHPIFGHVARCRQ